MCHKRKAAEGARGGGREGEVPPQAGRGAGDRNSMNNEQIIIIIPIIIAIVMIIIMIVILI